LVQHAREAEANLLSKIGAGSTAVTTSSLIGFGRDFLVQLRRAATGYRSRHRLDPSTRLKAIIPSWVYDAMAADLALSMPGDGTLSVSQAEINGYLAGVNVDLVATLDGNVFGAQASGAVNEFPDSFDWYLFAEGTFLFLDGGTLDLGIIRDSSLVGTNDYKMFIETFENVAKVGIESLKVTSTISVNGVAAALRDTTGGATAAANSTLSSPKIIAPRLAKSAGSADTHKNLSPSHRLLRTSMTQTLPVKQSILLMESLKGTLM